MNSRYDTITVEDGSRLPPQVGTTSAFLDYQRVFLLLHVDWDRLSKRRPHPIARRSPAFVGHTRSKINRAIACQPTCDTCRTTGREPPRTKRLDFLCFIVFFFSKFTNVCPRG